MMKGAARGQPRVCVVIRCYPLLSISAPVTRTSHIVRAAVDSNAGATHPNSAVKKEAKSGALADGDNRWNSSVRATLTT
jgi:hypothetical protein